MDIINMKQERARLVNESRAIMDKYDNTLINAEDQAILDKMDNDISAYDKQIAQAEKQLERERAAGEKPAGENKNTKQTELFAAFRNAIVFGDQSAIAAYNSLQQATPSQAGYLVAPQEFVSELIRDLADATFMRQEATVLPALVGAQSLGYPTRTAAMTGGAWGTEISTVPDVTSMQVGMREFKPRPHTALEKISKTLIRNLANSDGLVRGEFAEYFSGAYETAYMLGNGANCPLGVFVASDDGIPTSRDVSTGNTATEIKIDGLIEAKFAVKSQYQNGAKWLFHRDAVKQLAKLKDSDGQYIWQPSVVLNTPDVLLGKPVLMSEYAPNTFTTGQYVGLFGDFKNGYWIVDSLLMEIQVLLELYAGNNQIGYIGRMETDGAPVRPNAFSRVKLG